MMKLSRQQAIASLFSAALLGPAALASTMQTSTNSRYGMVVQSKGKVTRIDKTGNILWQYDCAYNSHDIRLLPNGNVLVTTQPSVIEEITPEKKVVWSWNGKAVAPHDGPIEIHSFERLENGNTIISESGNKRIIEVDPKGIIVHSIPLTVEKPDWHRDTRRVRRTDKGTYLVAHEGMGMVREYDKAGKILWEHKLELGTEPATPGANGHGVSIFNVLSLKNGNVLIGGGNNNRVYEVDRAGKTVWSIERDELKAPDGKAIHLCWITSLNVLRNGNMVFATAFAGADQPIFVEVNRKKEVVWAKYPDATIGDDVCAFWLTDIRGSVIR